jgi:predicted ATP-grasp superfamily ATP-dependent carboligase
MPVFVHEFFCSGAFDGDLDDSSLAREGLAMLAAVIEDFSRCPDSSGFSSRARSDERARVVTTLDARLHGLAATMTICEQARVAWVESPADERRLFQQLAGMSAATLVIAPETGGCLIARRRLTDAAGGRFVGPSLEAIRVCGDKLAFCEHLGRHAVPTLPTSRLDFFAKSPDGPFPLVVKPRDGAGSVNTFAIRDPREWQSRRDELAATFAAAGQEAIAQPFVSGRALSTAALIGREPDSCEIFPLAEQRLSRDGRFHYGGGRIPAADLSPEIRREAAAVVRAACRSLPGLGGYVGFDLIASPAEPHVRIVEANPRLTTSYVGYRRLTAENLAARIVDPDAARKPIVWDFSVADDAVDSARYVEFDADGTVRVG